MLNIDNQLFKCAKKIKPYLLIVMVMLTACDCYVVVKGKVVSSSTGKPISGAEIIMVDQDRSATTDSEGDFLIDKQTGFCFEPEIKVTKAHYKPFQVTLASDSKTRLYQVKYQEQSITLDPPVYLDSTKKEPFITRTSINKFSEDFERKGDSLIIFLDDDNPETEIERIRKKLKTDANNAK